MVLNLQPTARRSGYELAPPSHDGRLRRSTLMVSWPAVKAASMPPLVRAGRAETASDGRHGVLVGCEAVADGCGWATHQKGSASGARPQLGITGHPVQGGRRPAVGSTTGSGAGAGADQRSASAARAGSGSWEWLSGRPVRASGCSRRSLAGAAVGPWWGGRRSLMLPRTDYSPSPHR